MAQTLTLSVKERLLDAAITLLKKKGVGGATARAICDVVGVKQPALYHHYGQLDSLHAAAVDEVFRRTSEYYKPAAETGSPEKSIRQSWDLFLAFSKDNPQLFLFIHRQIVCGDLPNSIRRAFQYLVDDLTILDEQQGLSVSPMQGAQMLWAGANGAATLVAAADHQAGVDLGVASMIFDALMEKLLAV